MILPGVQTEFRASCNQTGSDNRLENSQLQYFGRARTVWCRGELGVLCFRFIPTQHNDKHQQKEQKA